LLRFLHQGQKERVAQASQICIIVRSRQLQHCPGDTVVWANTRSHIYHFRGTSYYGNTASGAYMCEQDALAKESGQP